MKKHTGVQIYTVRSLMTDEKSISNVFGAIADMGYTEIQCAGYSHLKGHFGLDGIKYSRLAAEAGLSVCGMMCSFDDMIADPQKIMEEHHILGTKNIGLGGMPEAPRKDFDALKKFVDDFNRLGQIFSTNGFSLGYHNHSFEFRKLNGKRIMDVLVDELDKQNINFILDTYWVQHGGGDVCSWIEKLTGRIDILHLKDMAMEDNAVFAEIGMGNLDFDKIIETAKKCGVNHYVVEQDECKGSPLDSLKLSYDYLKKYTDI